MEPPSAEDDASSESQPSYWKRVTTRGIEGGISAVIATTVVGASLAVVGILRGTLQQWLHLLDSVWLITACAAIAIFALGFVLGAGYATTFFAYTIAYLWASLVHKTMPKRGWWLAPIDWLVAGGIMLGMAAILVKMSMSEKLKARHTRKRLSQEPPAEDLNALRAENAKLRTENARLRAQAPGTSPDNT